jgi:hypothetical protein
VFITGYTDSPGSTVKIPLANPNPGHDYYQSTNANGPAGSGGINAFIAEFNTSGSIYWSTYFGGAYNIWGYGIALDASDDIYITGSTYDEVPFATIPASGTYTAVPNAPNDCFVAGFNNNLQYVWGTPIGGNGDDESYAAATDKTNNLLYIVGKTASTYTTYPTVQYDGGYFQSTNPEPSGDVTSFITRFDLIPISAGINTINDESSGINVFPNPFSDNIFVEMDITQNENIQFILYNSIGQMVYYKNSSEQPGTIHQEIDLSLLSDGIYLLKVDEGNLYFTKKIVKQD